MYSPTIELTLIIRPFDFFNNGRNALTTLTVPKQLTSIVSLKFFKELISKETKALEAPALLTTAHRSICTYTN